MGMRSSNSGNAANWINVAYCAAGGVLHSNDEATKLHVRAAKTEAEPFSTMENLSFDGAKVTETIRESLANAGVLERDRNGNPLTVEIEGNLDFVALDERDVQGKKVEYFKMVLSDKQENGTIDKYSFSVDFTSSLAQSLIVKLLSASPNQRLLFKPWQVVDHKGEKTYVTHHAILLDVATGDKVEKPSTFGAEIKAVDKVARERLEKAGIDDPKTVNTAVAQAKNKYYRDIVMTLIGRFQRANDNNQGGSESQGQRQAPAPQQSAPQQQPSGQSGYGGYRNTNGNQNPGIQGRQQPANRAPAPMSMADLDDDIPF